MKRLSFTEFANNKFIWRSALTRHAHAGNFPSSSLSFLARSVFSSRTRVTCLRAEKTLVKIHCCSPHFPLASPAFLLTRSTAVSVLCDTHYRSDFRSLNINFRVVSSFTVLFFISGSGTAEKQLMWINVYCESFNSSMLSLSVEVSEIIAVCWNKLARQHSPRLLKSAFKFKIKREALIGTRRERAKCSGEAKGEKLSCVGKIQ